MALETVVDQQEDTILFRNRKMAHVSMVLDERLEYRKKQEKAILYRNQYCSIIINGADRSAFGIPHFVTKTKNIRGRAMRLIGVLEHQKPSMLHLFTKPEERATGADHIVEAIHSFLSDLMGRKYPSPTLLMQMVNCSRIIISLCFCVHCVPCYMGCVSKSSTIIYSYRKYLQGHRSGISRTLRRLKSTDTATLSDFHKEFLMTYRYEACVIHMRYVARWSCLCEQYCGLKAVKHFLHFRNFLLHVHELTSREQTECWYLVWCGLIAWKSGNSLDLLEIMDNPVFSNIFQTFEPLLLKMSRSLT